MKRASVATHEIRRSNDMAVIDRVREITADKLSVELDEVQPESKFTDDLNADSLDLVEMMMAFEDEFSTEDKQLEIPDEAAENIVTVQDAVNYLKSEGVKDDD